MCLRSLCNSRNGCKICSESDGKPEEAKVLLHSEVEVCKSDEINPQVHHASLQVIVQRDKQRGLENKKSSKTRENACDEMIT